MPVNASSTDVDGGNHRDEFRYCHTAGERISQLATMARPLIESHTEDVLGKETRSGKVRHQTEAHWEETARGFSLVGTRKSD